MSSQQVEAGSFTTRQPPMYSEDWDPEEDETEEESEEEEEVDDSVREDMRKLELTFKGISERFRLINRIGEGNVLEEVFHTANDTNRYQVPSPLSTKRRIFSTISIAMTGTKMANMTMSEKWPGKGEDFRTVTSQKTAHWLEDDRPTSPSRRST